MDDHGQLSGAGAGSDGGDDEGGPERERDTERPPPREKRPDRRRFLIAEAPHRPDGERFARVVPAEIGVLPWSADRPWLSVIVKQSHRFDPKDKGPAARLVAIEAAPLQVGAYASDVAREGGAAPVQAGAHASDVEGGAPVQAGAHASGVEGGAPLEGSAHGEVRCDDFVPVKEQLDLVLVGQVEVLRSSSGDPRLRRAAVGFGDRLARFLVGAEVPGLAPLRPPHTRGFGGHPMEVGPQRCHDGAAHDFAHEEGFDFAQYQAAPESLRHDGEGGPVLRVEGLWNDRESLAIAMPPLVPRAIVDYAEAGSTPVEVRLWLDTVVVDMTNMTITVTYRGHAETSPKPRLDVDRILLGWAPRATWESEPDQAWRAALRELPRGEFGWAVERDDALAGEPPPALTGDELAMARYETWDHTEAAVPELEVEEAATLSAELLEQRAPRAEVLRQRGIDEYRWCIEERAWAEHLAAVSDDESDTTAARYAEAFARAHEAQRTPREDEVTAAQYAVLSARVERGDPTTVLAEAGLGLGAWMRLDRRFSAMAERDAALDQEITRVRDAEEARLDAEQTRLDAEEARRDA